ncbi:MAG: Lrp/AsnC ligand binding domain-containing protein [Candidatus Thermoplasmatota archaeon]|nr:Lrp/AsnC ligand binding domain-containing protein [Candidatus Thermoplasmatota archaeon]
MVGVDNFIVGANIAAEKFRWKIMINAYILISMRPGYSDRAIGHMRKIENIAKISVVAGEYDIVVRVQVEALENLLGVTDKIQLIEGVNKTTTQVIEKELAL